MKLHLVLVVLAAGALLAADEPKKGEGDNDAVKKEKEKLRGTWVMTEAVMDGEKVPNPSGQKATLVFTNDKVFIMNGEKKDMEGPYVIDPARNPKTIDVPIMSDSLGSDGSRKTEMKTAQGIYSLMEDSLTICLPVQLSEGPRPTKLESKPKSGLMLVTLKRQKEK